MRQAGVGANRYAYSFNDPVNLSDWNGNAVCFGACIAGVAALVTVILGIDHAADRANDGKVNGNSLFGNPVGMSVGGIVGAVGDVMNQTSNGDDNNGDSHDDDNNDGNNNGCDPSTDPSCDSRVCDVLRGISSSCINNYRCTDFADEFREGLNDAGIDFSVEDVRAANGRDFIWSDNCQCNISKNGFHTGTRVGDTVYDNLNPNGISYRDWISDLFARDGFQ